MDIIRAQTSDWAELEQLYRRNHPDCYRGFARPWWRSQTFVAKDDGNDDTIMGFVSATHAGRQARRHGVIRLFEVAREDRDPLLERNLMRTCVAWLEAQWCRFAYIPALRNQDYAWLARELGAGAGGYGATIPLMPHPPKWHWVLDPETGMLYPEAGPEGSPPGPPPRPVQAARQVWN